MKDKKEYKTTSSGFRFYLDEKVLDDWEAFEMLNKIDEGDSSAVIKVVPKLLGTKQYEGLKKFLKKKEGKVRVTSMVREIGEIFTSKQVKN